MIQQCIYLHSANIFEMPHLKCICKAYTAHICTSFKLFRRQCVRQNWHCVSACAQSWHTQHKACYLPGSRGCWRIYKEMSTLAPGQVTLANNMSQCHCVNNRPKAPVTMQGTLDEGHGNSAVNLQWCLDFFCNHNMVIPSCVRRLLRTFHCSTKATNIYLF